MENLKELGFTVNENVVNNIETSFRCSTHIEWVENHKKRYEISTRIFVDMGIILAGYLQSKHFNYDGGGMDLHELQKPFKNECFDFLINNNQLHSITRIVGKHNHTWKFSGKKTKSGNAVYKLATN